MTQAALNALVRDWIPMAPAHEAAWRRALPLARIRRAGGLVLLATALACGLTAPARAAQPFIWDQDGNGIDDRIESVHALGWSASFELGDTTLRQRILVLQGGPELVYAVYVVWKQTPTPGDLSQLAFLGMPALTRIEAVPATRSLATFAQVQAAAAMPSVQRVEAVPLLFPRTRDGTAAIGVRDATHRVFPTVAGTAPGVQGHGVVVAFLDTGINDLAEGNYPGHEALRGRCLGGAVFVTADSVTQTPKNGSVNPSDHGGQATHAHATHVAGIAVGAGSAGGYAAGVAPLAKYIDVKVLNDGGSGISVPEALDWCISNRNRDWGSPDPDERGIDVINLSLSSPDQSDGQDLAARLAARAVQLGIVVVASMGNDGLEAHVPSPAGGDGVIAVGAWDVARTPEPVDDAWASFNNQGPRASDGDSVSGGLDTSDELKPDVLAPGVNVLSANGDVFTDGTKWQRLSGTSMAAAFVSGVCALLRESAPTATPAEIAGWLRATARRPLPGALPGVGGADPAWRSTRGFGLVDAYAALLERQSSTLTQVRRFVVTGSDTTVSATLWTGRESGVASFVFERAPDAGGAPGDFAPVDSVPAAGVGSLAGPVSVTEYAHTWAIPAPERGQRFWYRIGYTESGVRRSSPATSWTSALGPRVATLEVTVVHDALDSDVESTVRGGAFDAGGPVFELPGTSGAATSDWVNGTSVTGSQSWTFRLPVPAGAASAFLPPDAGHPWALHVHEAGSLTRSGRVTEFRLTSHTQGGDVVYVGQPVPQQTIEGAEVVVSIPPATTDVPGAAPRALLRVRPNPARAGHALHLVLGPGAGGAATVFDLAGREVARVPLAASAEGWEGDWQARDASGRALHAGVYLVRGRSGPAARLILLDP